MWFEDTKIGERRILGTHTFTEEEIIAFGRKYDPQSFHVDPGAAKSSMFGGLIASGWHTASVWMRLAIDDRKRAMAANGGKGPAGVSPGVEDLRWLKPVRPGDTLTFSTEVVETVDLKSRPELGLVKSLNEARGPDGELYMSFIGKGLVPRRPHETAKGG